MPYKYIWILFITKLGIVNTNIVGFQKWWYIFENCDGFFKLKLDNYSQRIRHLRTLTNLSREQFEEEFGINRNTLKSWELGKNPITEKAASQLTESLEKGGIICTPEWLIFGIGDISIRKELGIPDLSEHFSDLN